MVTSFLKYMVQLLEQANPLKPWMLRGPCLEGRFLPASIEADIGADLDAIISYRLFGKLI